MNLRRAFGAAALSFLIAGCGGEARPEPAAPEPAPLPAPAPAETAPPPAAIAPAPAPVPPAAPEPKLKMQVFTGSPEGFLVTATLVTGAKDAVLIDSAFTLDDGKKLAELVRASGKSLTTIYVTHSHPDHYFGAGPVKDAFPNAKLVALQSTVDGIKKTAAAKVKQWKPLYKDAITDKPLVPEVLAAKTIELEGEKLEITDNVQGDEAQNSYVWIPALRALVCGDIVYDGVHPWTAETTAAERKSWGASLDKLAALNAVTVVPGHQKPDKKLDGAGITFTKDYLTAFDASLAASKDAAELEAKLKAQYPDAALDVIAKLGAEAAFKKPKKK
jgi:glyoxylase-like metal-dependent hydrolase (beta-lactamase superfamily II)